MRAALMPADFTIDETHRLVISTLSGELDVEMLRDLAERLAHASAFRPTMNHMLDCTGVSSVALDREQMLELADWQTPFSTESRLAIVCPTQLTFKVASVFQSLYQGPRHIAVFRSRSDAESWLG